MVSPYCRGLPVALDQAERLAFHMVVEAMTRIGHLHRDVIARRAFINGGRLERRMRVVVSGQSV